MTQHTRKGVAKRVLSVISASALALVGVVAIGSTAASALGPDDTGSITVHKHAGAPGAAGTGVEITGPAANLLGVGVGNVFFKLERVTYDGDPIDLGTTDGWDLIYDGMTATNLSDDYGFDPVVASAPTNSSGILDFPNLPLGLYLVTELPGGNPDVETMSDPFLVTVPHRAADDTEWITDVHVYPKNQLRDAPTKTVSEPTGNDVTWTITTTVPRPPSGNVYTAFSITDTMDPKLDIVSATVTRDGVALPDSVVDITGQVVTVTPVIGEVMTGQVYVVTIVTTVTDAGAIVNTAVRNVNGTNSDIGPAQTNWGKVQVLKLDATTEETLAGAKFELWTAETEPEDRTLVLSEETTDANGIITFAHVWLGNDAVTTKDFCLRETAPPVGYSIANEWTCVELASAGTGLVQQAVDNPKRDTPNLPLTGAAGTTAFMAGGIALLLTAAGVALLSSRRRGRAEID